ncbi:MAG TPA: STAS domain-containing protein [Candidatus Acidoferrum sp.]|nr:STAS domain-containing protein [Candidatus Acidoferrum sp.]
MILTIDRKRIEPDIAVLEMKGRIVLGNDAMTVEWELAELMKENQKKVVFDLAGVTMVDSTGVGIIVMCHAKLRKSGGALRIAGVNGIVADTLRLTSVDKLIEFYPSVEEASAGF